MYKNLLSETIEHQRGEHGGNRPGLAWKPSSLIHLGPLGPLLFTDGWPAHSSDSGGSPPDE